MNDPRGRRLREAKLKAKKTRGAENRKDEPIYGVGARIGKTSERDGPEAGRFRTERRGR
jgi:hypothetical protein